MVDGTKSQQETLKEIDNIFKIFKGSNGTIRPHFIVVGPSGAGKTFNIQRLTNENNLKFVEINAAQLTKEGTEVLEREMTDQRCFDIWKVESSASRTRKMFI